MAASVFISFASTDRKTAMTICSALEARGFKCWISARDIMPGENFQSAIVKAIRGANVMLLVFTGNSNASEEMSKELALASQRKMPVIPLRVEDVAPNDAFAYEFATRQWIDFFADWEFAISQLAAQISKIIEADPNKPVVTTPVTIESKSKAKARAAEPTAAPAAAEPASFLAAAPAAAAPEADLVGVLDPPADHTFDSDPAAEDAPVKKGPGALLFVGAAVVIAAVIGVAVFAMGGKKGTDTAAKPPAAEQSAAKPGPSAPPTPTPPTVPAPDAVTQANATPGAPPATPATAAGAPGAATTTAAAAPATTTAAKPKRAAAAPAKKHAPLRASRSDVPY